MIYKNVNGTQKLVTNIRKPKKWRRFEYLLSSGTLWIDTGINPRVKPRVVAVLAMLNNADKDYWGNKAINGSAYYANFAAYQLYYYRYGSTTSQRVNYVVALSTIHEWDVSDKVYVDGVLKFTSANTYTYNASQGTIEIFKAGRSSTLNSTYRLYSFKLYDGDTLVRDFVPAQYNGEYGLWDLIQNKFYGNKGTGTFTVGLEIGKPYEEIEKIVIPGNSEYPRGLELCDYLQGDGAAYINSGYSLNRNCSIDITLQLTEKVNQARFVGLQKSGCYLLMYSGDSGNNIKTYTKIASGGTYSTFIAHNTKINTYYINNSSHKSLVNETSKVTHTDIPATDDYYGNCYLFWANGAAAGTQTTARIYSCRIYDNEVLVRDFIPCIYNNEPGMWDKVNRIFYGNSGSGNFIALSNTNYQEQLQDSVPSNVTLHEYIQGDGTNYIDTGIVLTKDSTIEFTAQLLDKTNQLRLIGVTDTNLRFFVYIGDSGANVKTCTNFNATNTYDTLSVFNKAKHKYVLNEYNTHKCYLNGELVHTYTGIPDNDTNTKTCYIFWANGESGNPKSACRIYECKIYTNNVLVGHFVPCKYNGLAGLWDIVTQTFYGNSSANFSLGPEITLQKEIPIWVLKNALVQNGTAYINTGIIANDNTKIKVKAYSNCTGSFYFTGTRADVTGVQIFSLSGSVNGSTVTASVNGSRTLVPNYTRVSTGLTFETELITNGDGTYSYYFKDLGSNYTFSLDNVNYNSISANTQNLFIFSNGYNIIDSTNKIYYYKIWQDNVLVRDFVPATMGGRPGLYDKVNHKMYFNANSSGNFTVE